MADRLQRTNPRLPRDKAEFLAPHWAKLMPDGGGAPARGSAAQAAVSGDGADGRHVRDVARDQAPVLWVVAEESHIARWLAAGGDAETEIARRFAHVPHGSIVTIADAGHMLHHDQPEAVARALEAFVARQPGGGGRPSIPMG